MPLYLRKIIDLKEEIHNCIILGMKLISLYKQLYYSYLEFIKKIANTWENKVAFREQYSSIELDKKWNESYRVRLRKFACDIFSHYIETDFVEEKMGTLECTKDTPENSLLIKKFCSSGQDYNWMLRKKQEDIFLKEVGKYIAQYPIKKDIIVYRGVDEGVLENNLEAANDVNGVDLHERGFLFTSLTRAGVAEFKHKLRIYLPQGTCAIYTGNVNGQEQIYQEVVVQCGAKLKILSKDKDFYNCVLIETDSI